MPELPFGLRWEIEPASWRFDGDLATVVAAGTTDYFVDPAGSAVALNGARALTAAPRPPWQFSARVGVDFQATFDAAVLLLWSDDSHFAKLCFERSPQGSPTVVSVVTRGRSDDANAWVVDGATVWLRISSIAEGVYAFHSGEDGHRWDLVRYFELAGSAPVKVGIAAQSPTGDGCTATFADFRLVERPLVDLRDGS